MVKISERKHVTKNGVVKRNPKRSTIEQLRKIDLSRRKTRISEKGYREIYLPEHQNPTRDGYVREHRLLVELESGRFLSKDLVVHHKNRDRQDNRMDNLEVMRILDHNRI